LTDQTIELFDRLVGAMFSKAKGRHARAFQAIARAINEKVRLYARIGAALIAAREAQQDAYGAIATVARVPPIEKATPPEAAAMDERLYAMMPRI
jgi:endo-alpha-1,4-polygalactosaminidase (GH114 family)